MESWYRDRIYQNKVILLSESGFTNDELAIRYLTHFIQHSKASPSKPPKLLSLTWLLGITLFPLLFQHILRTICNLVI